MGRCNDAADGIDALAVHSVAGKSCMQSPAENSPYYLPTDNDVFTFSRFHSVSGERMYVDIDSSWAQWARRRGLSAEYKRL